MPAWAIIPSPARETIALSARNPSTVTHVFVLVIVVVAVYFIRLDDLTIRGEESRRATVAMEMIATGDWIVPRQQGNPNFMSARPPLQSWMIAIIGVIRGEVDEVAVRLPSVLAVLLTVLLIYGYSRSFLSATGAFAAGAAYATMGQVMELGRLGETDAIFTLFVSGSLLLWHLGVIRRWRPTITWSVAWLFVALATLTKGPQAMVYFMAGVTAYLHITRQWRFAFSWSNLTGMTIALVVIGLWQFPFVLIMGVDGLRHIYTGDVSLYLKDWRVAHVAEHYAMFPLKVLGCLAPWSLFFLCVMRSEVRRGMGMHRDHLLFLATCLAVSFPTVWLVPGANTRFFMSMYPCLAVIVGVIIDRCTQDDSCRHLWNQALAGCAVTFAGFAMVILVASLLAPDTPIISQPPAIAAIVVVSSLALAAIAWWSRTAGSDRRAIAGILSIAGFTGVVHAGLVVNQLVQTSVDTSAQMASLKNVLPDDVALSSFGPVPHLFAYHYGKPIALRPMPSGDHHMGFNEYFCTTAEPPFAFEEIARINCDRSRSETPQCIVIVGRSIPAMQAQALE